MSNTIVTTFRILPDSCFRRVLKFSFPPGWVIFPPTSFLENFSLWVERKFYPQDRPAIRAHMSDGVRPLSMTIQPDAGTLLQATSHLKKCERSSLTPTIDTVLGNPSKKNFTASTSHRSCSYGDHCPHTHRILKSLPDECGSARLTSPPESTRKIDQTKRRTRSNRRGAQGPSRRGLTQDDKKAKTDEEKVSIGRVTARPHTEQITIYTGSLQVSQLAASRRGLTRGGSLVSLAYRLNWPRHGAASHESE